MDLVSAILGISQAQSLSSVQASVAGKALDVQREQGAAAVRLIQSASGQSAPGDALVAAATGLGGKIDTYA